VTKRHQVFQGSKIMREWSDKIVTTCEHAGFIVKPNTDYMVTWPDRTCRPVFNSDCLISKIVIDKTAIIDNDSPNTGCDETTLIALSKLSVYRDKKEISWFKVGAYGSPHVTYLVAATSIDKVKKSLGNLSCLYRITYMDHADLTEFFKSLVKIHTVKVAAGIFDLMLIMKSEACVLRILL